MHGHQFELTTQPSSRDDGPLPGGLPRRPRQRESRANDIHGRDASRWMSSTGLTRIRSRTLCTTASRRRMAAWPPSVTDARTANATAVAALAQWRRHSPDSDIETTPSPEHWRNIMQPTAVSQTNHRQLDPVRNHSKALPAEGFVRQSGLIPDIVPFSPATLWRKVKSKEFPAPVKLSTRITAWRVQEVREWLERQK